MAKKNNKDTLSRHERARIRTGKTARDKESGAHSRRLLNGQARASWRNSSKPTNATFPVITCNGKKNRTRVTGKGGREIVSV